MWGASLDARLTPCQAPENGVYPCDPLWPPWPMGSRPSKTEKGSTSHHWFLLYTVLYCTCTKLLWREALVTGHAVHVERTTFLGTIKISPSKYVGAKRLLVRAYPFSNKKLDDGPVLPLFCLSTSQFWLCTIAILQYDNKKSTVHCRNLDKFESLLKCSTSKFNA